MSSATLSPTRRERIATGRLPRATLIAGALAAVLNVIVFYIATVLGVDLTGPFMGPEAPPITLAPVQVIISSAVPALGAGLLLWLLGRFTPRPITIFAAIVVVLGLLSLGAPLTLPVSTAIQVTLGAMHVVAATAIASVLITQTRE
jgi:hypothetical protein